jgi:hypothetical protein
MMKRLLFGLGLFLASAAPLYADVTISSTLTGRGMGDTGMPSKSYIQGSKMRTETGGRVTIMDAATRQMISLNPEKKEAVVYNLADLQTDMQKMIAGEPKVTMTPNGQTRTILNTSCAGYDLAMTIPMKMGDTTMAMNMTGAIWIAKGVPGASDYAGFYTAAAENGLFFGNPDAAKGPGGAQLKSTVEMYRKIAALGGIAYQTEMQMKFDADGLMGSMMNKAGGGGLTTTVTAVSTEALDPAMFTVPADFKTKTR